MNALIGVRSNAAGLMNLTREKRAAAREEIQSMTKANILGRLGKAREAAASATKSAPISKAAKSSTTSDSKTSVTDAAGDALDRDAFLQLLVTQMQNQDPTAPMDNSQMIAQLAQFSALEQMQNLNDTATAVSGNIDQLNFISANSLVGRKVTALDSNGDTVTGVVDQVHMSGSVVYLTIGESIVSMAGVISVAAPTTTGSS